MTGKSIVCVGFADWQTDLWTNQHHLMSRLARDNDVLFIESLGLRRPQLAGRDLRRIVRRLRRGLGPPRNLDGVRVLSPLVLPLHSSAVISRLNARLLRRAVAKAARGMRRPILWGYVPQAEILLEPLDPEMVIYHCVDDIAAQERVHTESFEAAERRFAGRADLVLASAPALAERMAKLNPNVLFAPNVADTALFATALDSGPVDPAIEALPTPRIVFTGAIVSTKLDFGLICELARMRPDWSIALVGPIGPGQPDVDVGPLEAEPNVHLLGGRAYRDLPAVLRGADAAIIPYAVNELTRSVFPMKVYEYLAAGLPVVATRLPSLAGVEGIAFASDAAELAHCIDGLLAEDSAERRRQRSTRAAEYSWDARLAEIDAALERLA